jgi:hypothetical protein
VEHQVADPQGETVDDDDVAADGSESAGQVDLFFVGLPPPGPTFLDMALNALLHLFVEARAGGQEQSVPATGLAQLEGVAAFSGAAAAGDEEYVSHVD